MQRSFIDSGPIAETITTWLGERDEHSLGTLAAITGVPERTLYGIRVGERRRVEWNTADRVISRLDQNERWHTDLAAYWPLE